jgi:hypothetical protein
MRNEFVLEGTDAGTVLRTVQLRQEHGGVAVLINGAKVCGVYDGRDGIDLFSPNTEETGLHGDGTGFVKVLR